MSTVPARRRGGCLRRWCRPGRRRCRSPGLACGTPRRFLGLVAGQDPGAHHAAQLVSGQQPGEVLGAGHRQVGVGAALGDGAVPGGGEGDHLLHCRRPPCSSENGQLVGDEAGLGDQPPAGLHGLAVAEQPGTGGQGDTDVGLGGLDLQVDGVVVDLGLVQHGQMAAVQVAVALDPGVDHPPVQPGADLQGPRPVLRHKGGLQPSQVLVLHTHQAALDHPGAPALGILPGQPAQQRPHGACPAPGAPSAAGGARRPPPAPPADPRPGRAPRRRPGWTPPARRPPEATRARRYMDESFVRASASRRMPPRRRRSSRAV
jgi:hypothetical protein